MNGADPQPHQRHPQAEDLGYLDSDGRQAEFERRATAVLAHLPCRVLPESHVWWLHGGNTLHCVMLEGSFRRCLPEYMVGNQLANRLHYPVSKARFDAAH